MIKMIIKNICIVSIFSLFILSVALYFLSPYHSVNKIKKYLELGYIGSLNQIADLESVWCSLETQLDPEYSEMVSEMDSQANVLILGRKRFPIEKLINSYMTIPGITYLLLNKSNASIKPFKKKGIAVDDIRDLKFSNIEYDLVKNPKQFKVSVGSIKLILQFNNWSWKIVDIVLPKIQNYENLKLTYICKNRIINKIYGGKFNEECNCYSKQADNYDKSIFGDDIIGFNTNLLKVYSFNEGGINKFLALTEAIPIDTEGEIYCRACSKTIGGAIFFYNNSKLIMQHRTKSIFSINSFFKIDDDSNQIHEIGNNKYGIMLVNWTGNMGHFWGEYKLIAPIGNTIKIIGTFDAGEDDSGALGESATSYGVTYKFLESPLNEYKILSFEAKGVIDGKTVDKKYEAVMLNNEYVITP